MASTTHSSRFPHNRWRLLALLGALICASANAAHELLLTVDTENNLLSFYSDAPGTLLHSHSITGLQASEHIFGVTVASGVLYGLGSSSRLYTIDPNTGNATQVGSSFSTLLDGINFGCSAEANGMRVVSGEGTTNHQNLLINFSTGVVTVGPPLIYGGPFAVAGLAYDWSSSVWYVANAVGDTFYTLDPATGFLTLIGSSGITFPLYSGFTISAASGIAYFVSTVAGQAQLYTINKATGAATLIGSIGNSGSGANILICGMTTGQSGVNLMVSISPAGSGTVLKQPDQTFYAPDSTVTLTANPASGWVFGGWSGDTNSIANPMTVVMNIGKNITATFLPTLTLNVLGGGSVTKNPDQPSYAVGSTVTLTAQAPNRGWAFAGWSGDTNGLNNPITLTMSTNRYVTAIYTSTVPDLIVDNINASFFGSWATDAGTIGSGFFGQDFRYAPSDSATSAYALYQPDIATLGNYDVYIWYPYIYSYPYASSSVTYGVASLNGNEVFIVNQATGLGSGSWQLLAANRRFPPGTNGLVYILNSTSDLDKYVAADAVRWVWSVSQPYILNTSVVGGGIIIRNPDLPGYPPGAVVTLTAIPNSAWSFTGWSGSPNGMINPIKITMNTDEYITATFTNFGSACAPAPPGLVSWWRGASNALDVIGTNNGTLDGGVSFVPGKVGTAFSFDGVVSDVLIPPSPSLMFTSQFTLEAWIYPTDVSSYRQIFSWMALAPDQSYQLGLAPSGVLRIDISGDGTVYDSLTSSAGALSSNTWAHVAGTFNNDLLILYVNGVQVASKYSTITSLYTNTHYNMYIGTTPTGQQRFTGLIDELSAYNRDLSATEIQAIFSAGSLGKCLAPLYITSISRSATNVNLSWLAQRGVVYRAQYKTNLIPAIAPWLSLGGDTIATTNAASAIDVLPANIPQRFYRIELLP